MHEVLWCRKSYYKIIFVIYYISCCFNLVKWRQIWFEIFYSLFNMHILTVCCDFLVMLQYYLIYSCFLLSVCGILISLVLVNFVLWLNGKTYTTFSTCKSQNRLALTLATWYMFCHEFWLVLLLLVGNELACCDWPEYSDDFQLAL